MSDIIDLDTERSARTAKEPAEQAIHDDNIGHDLRPQDRPFRHPLVLFFELLSRYDSVPLPDGCDYRLIGTNLHVLNGRQWIPADKTINELIDIIRDLTRKQWHEIMTQCKS